MCTPFVAVLSPDMDGNMPFQVWHGTIFPVHVCTGECEVNVHIRGYRYHIFIQQHSHKNLLCIPNIAVKVNLINLTDTFQNKGILEKLGIEEIEAQCIADAISVLSKFI